MCDNWLAWPDRAGFPSVIAEGDDEIELCVFELFPRLAVASDASILKSSRRTFSAKGCGAGFGLAPAL